MNDTGLDLDRLQKVRSRGGRTIARCPACAEAGADKKGEHLFIGSDGRFGCVQYPGVDGAQHRKRIWELAGNSPPNAHLNGGTDTCLDEVIARTAQRLGKSETRRDWYLTAEGEKSFIVVRFDGNGQKEFRPYHRNGAGWVEKDPPGQLPLFNLPALLSRTNEPVYLVEGEKCCLALASIGLLATTSAHGAQSPHKTDWTPLAGRSVVNLPDNDEDGLSYQRKSSRILGELSPPATVRIVQLPDLPPKGDCVQWLERRDAQTPEDNRAELAELVAREHPESSSATKSGWLEALTKSVVSSSEMASLSLKPRQKLLGDFFCEGDLAYIYAYRGVGKTWFALLMARALSEGSSVGPWKAHMQVGVLYIDAEMPADLMQARDRGLTQGDGGVSFLNHEILFDRAQKVLNIADLEIQTAITQYCLGNRMKVLFLDNISTAASGIKENDSFAWEPIGNWLLQLRRHKIAVVIIHHAGRSGEARGTTKREDAAFWVIALDDARKNSDDQRGARFVSRFTKPSRNTQEEIPAYEWHFTTDETGHVDVQCKTAQSLDVFRRIIEDGVTNCTDIATEMKISPATVCRLAKKAFDAGWLEKAGNRAYRLIEPL